MSRHASLAMYDAGGGATAALWDDLRARLEADGIADVPQDLTVPTDYEAAWLDAELLLSQTCGYPLTHALDGRVRYLGTPVYDTDGTDGPYYRSALVVRAGDPAETLEELRGRRAAYNSVTSQSGYNAFRDAVAPLARDGRFFSAVSATGGHAHSLRAVIADKADIAAIDAISLALEPEEIRNKIKIIGWTAATPGLPYISGSGSSDAEVNTLRANISSAMRATSTKAARDYLKLTDFAVIDLTAYDVVPAMEQRAAALGYPHLN
jgi:ABC-type phosphate/phosphonate transport system substrate-binding protein